MTVLRRCRQALVALIALCFLVAPAFAAQNYKNFKVAVYIPAFVVEKLKDPAYLASSWDTLNKNVKIDKVYIETHRNRHLVDDATLEQVKKFFVDRGVAVAGGIAYVADESGYFGSYCYTNPDDRAMVKKISETTARHFDEIILDDFFFNNTKTDSDIAAKGSQSWTQFRLNLMDGAAKDLVIDPAKAINPHAKVIIKFPNWYEHFPGNGFDLDKEPKLFDGIYTGTETRDPVITDQQLQPYESYGIIRYFNNIAPGRNGGGWVDTFAIRSIDRYAEQLWDTMFAKAPEITLFFYGGLLEPATPGDRAAWQSLNTSFDWKQTLAASDNKPLFATVAGQALRQADSVVGVLGNPIAIKSYKPYQSTGEDFLHNYIGMLGIPVEITPNFPTDADVVLLTEAAKADPQIVSRIKTQLQSGKNVVITSNLLRAIQGHGIEDIVEMEVLDRKLSVDSYDEIIGSGTGTRIAASTTSPIVFPEIHFVTNDAWAYVRGFAGDKSVPLLMMDRYSKGRLFVWTMPDNVMDLYRIPQSVLTRIKSYLLASFPIQLDAPSNVALFAYDNNTMIVESFLSGTANAKVSVAPSMKHLRNVVTNETINASARQDSCIPAERHRGPEAAKTVAPPPVCTSFDLTINPHSFLVLRAEP